MVRICLISILSVIILPSIHLSAKPNINQTVKPTTVLEVKGAPTLSKDGTSVIWQGKEYKPIDEAGVYYYEADSVKGVPMPIPRTTLKDALSRNGFHGIVRCELIDYVDCTKTDHGFIDDGKSRVLKLADGNFYRVTGPGGRLSWF
jgi:hypothetical protein